MSQVVFVLSCILETQRQGCSIMGLMLSSVKYIFSCRKILFFFRESGNVVSFSIKDMLGTFESRNKKSDTYNCVSLNLFTPKTERYNTIPFNLTNGIGCIFIVLLFLSLNYPPYAL